jgi:hypothetical protein
VHPYGDRMPSCPSTLNARRSMHASYHEDGDQCACSSALDIKRRWSAGDRGRGGDRRHIAARQAAEPR